MLYIRKWEAFSIYDTLCSHRNSFTYFISATLRILNQIVINNCHLHMKDKFGISFILNVDAYRNSSIEVLSFSALRIIYILESIPILYKNKFLTWTATKIT